jgi:hypothetical protein
MVGERTRAMTETFMEKTVTNNDSTMTARRGGGWGLRAAGLAVAATCAALMLASPAFAALSVVPPDDPSGLGFDAHLSDSQAGAHSDVTTAFFTTPPLTFDQLFTLGNPLRNTIVDLPPGQIGNPEAVAKCKASLLDPGRLAPTRCPPASQVGTVQIFAQFEGGEPFSPGSWSLWAMEPSGEDLADLVFKIGPTPIHIIASVRPDDHGVRLAVENAHQLNAITGVKVSLWGVPAAPEHDFQRCFTMPNNGDPNFCDPEVSGGFGELYGNPGVPPVPFFSNTTSCGGELATSIQVESWWEAGFSDPVTDVDPAATGCDKLPFDPSVDVSLTRDTPGSPTGLAFDLSIPQNDAPGSLATAHLRDVKVTLPEGMSINPAAADGLASCSDAQLAIGTDDPVRCPEASKIGTVSAITPTLDDPVEGSVYVGRQASDDPQSGRMFRLFIDLRGPGGLLIKLEGQVRANSATGRLETTFEDNPQLPVESLRVELKSGPRAPLATPPDCGSKTFRVALTSWAGHALDLTDSVQIACPGVGGFSPAFAAGSVNAVASAFSPFTLSVDRDDDEQYLADMAVDLPKGSLAKLRGVELCPDAVAGDGTPGTCPAGSRIGTATVGAGAGSPFFLKGDVFLTGPYKGGPYGLSVAVHAKAGPFDLGVVKVRQAIYVDPETAELSVVSDPLPQVVRGVPVRLRSVDVDVDRPAFTINPTSCAEKEIAATFTSVEGAVHKTSSRFQVGDCRALAFRPRLSMRLTGRKQRRTGGHPGLRVKLTQAGGQANLKGLAVKLPQSLALDPDNAQGLCSFEEARKADPKCPASSIVGRATAYTPVLNKPLSGPVYFAENKRLNKFGRLISTLPSLVITLRGEVSINVRQNSDVKGGRLISTTATIPDAPVSRFDLRLKGGDGGILTVTRTERRRFDLCRGRHTALVESDGQNGRRADFAVRVKTPCGKAAKSGKARLGGRG